MLNYTIGYGYGFRYFYSLIWMVALVVLGTVVFLRTEEGKTKNISFGIEYSLDMLLPIIKLREIHYRIDFNDGWRPARIYFYFHQLMGYVLAFFVIAGLSGLTK